MVAGSGWTPDAPWRPGLKCSCGQPIMPCGLTASELEALTADMEASRQQEEQVAQQQRQRQQLAQAAALLAASGQLQCGCSSSRTAQAGPDLQDMKGEATGQILVSTMRQLKGFRLLS